MLGEVFMVFCNEIFFHVIGYLALIEKTFGTTILAQKHVCRICTCLFDKTFFSRLSFDRKLISASPNPKSNPNSNTNPAQL